MFNVDDPHQFFREDDDNGEMVYSWTMDKIERKDATVWIMNHFFVNPKMDSKKILHDQMKIVMFIAQKSHLPVWPLDPLVINYFNDHPDFESIWYHQPSPKNGSI